MGLEEKLAVGSTVMFISNAKIILNLITSGLLERVPRLNFISVESGVGWIPFVIETLSLSPIKYFRRQIYASFWFEGRDAASSIRRVGVNNIPLD